MPPHWSFTKSAKVSLWRLKDISRTLSQLNSLYISVQFSFECSTPPLFCDRDSASPARDGTLVVLVLRLSCFLSTNFGSVRLIDLHSLVARRKSKTSPVAHYRFAISCQLASVLCTTSYKSVSWTRSSNPHLWTWRLFPFSAISVSVTRVAQVESIFPENSA